MKKGILILSVLAGFFITSFNTSCNTLSTSSEKYPLVLERKDTVGTSSEFQSIQTMYASYIKALKKDTNDDLSKLKLVELYINEARITGNLSYYNNASMKVLSTITDKKHVKQDIYYKALVYKATVYMSLHQFADAQKNAELALAMNPFDADIYGVLMDANVELGKYDEALKMCDKMMSIRPDIRSYSRVSYMRQIYGDNTGAIAAMRMAVESGAQGLENTEWARVQLGDLYLNTGHADTAKMLYESSLYARPDYPFAEMGLAKVAASQKQYDEAITHCKNAIRVISESSFISYLGDLYKLKGDLAKADEVHKDVLKLMKENEEKNEQEVYARHNGNREMANACLNANQTEDALTFAKKDLALRPSNIDANELVAWIYYVKHDYAQAGNHINLALSTHSQNAPLLYKASLIFSSLAQTDKAKELMKQAMMINPFLQADYLIAAK